MGRIVTEKQVGAAGKHFTPSASVSHKSPPVFPLNWLNLIPVFPRNYLDLLFPLLCRFLHTRLSVKLALTYRNNLTNKEQRLKLILLEETEIKR